MKARRRKALLRRYERTQRIKGKRWRGRHDLYEAERNVRALCASLAEDAHRSVLPTPYYSTIRIAPRVDAPAPMITIGTVTCSSSSDA